MFKKILTTCGVLALTSGVAFATCNTAPYVGVSVGERTNTSTEANFRGIPGSLFLGWGGEFGQSLYLAGELWTTVATAPITNNGLKSTYAYGVSLLPGLFLSDHTMGFFRVGLSRTHFDTTVSGVHAGLGLQTSLTQNWDLRGEYIFTASKNFNGIDKPRSDEFVLGILYRFD